MKKSIWLTFIAIATIITFSSCENTETYADKVKNEKKTIKRFLKDNDIEVISTYPIDGKFKDNQFFWDESSGIYIHVVDTGNGVRASNVAPYSSVYFRHKESRILPDTTQFTNISPGVQPLGFIYGQTNTYIASKDETNNDRYLFLSPGAAAPLKYVGEGGIVKIIIPFNQGSLYQQQAYEAAYCGYLKYTTID